MKAWTGCLLLALLAAPGCLTLAEINELAALPSNKFTAAPPAPVQPVPPAPVQPEDVKEENTHETAQRLSDEIEREQNTPPAGRR